MRRYLRYSVWLLLIGGVLYLTLPLLWHSIQPVQIVAIYPPKYYPGAQVVLTRKPISDSEKIAWWEANKPLILQQHVTFLDEGYSITFWNFADGYEPLPPDKDLAWFWNRYGDDVTCFDEITPKCLDKRKKFMKVGKHPSGRISYTIYGSQYDYWRDGEGGLLMKSKKDLH